MVTFSRATQATSARTIEMVLLLAAAGVFSAALIAVLLTQGQPINSGLLLVMGAFCGLLLIAHVGIRVLAPNADPLLLPCAAALNGLGLVMIFRLDLAASADATKFFSFSDLSHDTSRQVLWTAIGLLVFLVILGLLKDHRTAGKYPYILGVIGLVFLALPAILPASMSEINGAKNWIRLPGFTIQPGEFSKILLLLYFASVLVEKRELLTTAGYKFFGITFPRGRDLAPIGVAWALSILVMVFETDLGLSLLLFSTVLAMIYIATERISWIIIGLALFAAGATVAYTLFSHVQVRVQTWKNPFDTYETGGYQLSQALFGIASGGVTGTGLGGGHPYQIPFAKTDFVTVAFIEEIGVAGFIAMLMLYAVLIMRAFKIGMATTDNFGTLTASGLGASIAIQVFVVIGGVTALIPLTGLTTPFVSYGGSSLLANYALLAILLRISHRARTVVEDE